MIRKSDANAIKTSTHFVQGKGIIIQYYRSTDNSFLIERKAIKSFLQPNQGMIKIFFIVR